MDGPQNRVHRSTTAGGRHGFNHIQVQAAGLRAQPDHVISDLSRPQPSPPRRACRADLESFFRGALPLRPLPQQGRPLPNRQPDARSVLCHAIEDAVRLVKTAAGECHVDHALGCTARPH
jgi:hypothetical protein